MSLLEARDLGRVLPGHPPVTLVTGANLIIEAGSFTTIVGPSGCGKSSMLYLLGLIDRPTGGAVLLDGADVGGLDGDARAQIRLERFGFVFDHEDFLHLFHRCLPIMPFHPASLREGTPYVVRYKGRYRNVDCKRGPPGANWVYTRKRLWAFTMATT